jgi:hypothetical protein
MKKVRRTNIEPLTIRGDVEFYEAFGINAKKLAEMRSCGLPCYYDGKCFLYFPGEVEAWIKTNWQLNLPELLK